MKGYESYKESGIEWIGEIPEHWNKLKIGRSFDLIGSGTTPNTNVDKFYNEGNINWLNTGDLNDGYIFDTTKKITEVALKETSLRIFPEGSIVIALYGATIGKLGHLKIETTTNQACCVLSKSNKITNRFLFYFFLASRKNIISMSYGGGQPNISQELIKQLHLPTPSIEEQTAIASFLDYKTNLIDVTIEKKKRLIALLKEKRQAVINEAVTKGLNPNVPMKERGVEWLGEIPEHWAVKKLKHIAEISFSSVDRHEYNDELKVSICHYPDAYKNDKINNETVLSSGTCNSLEYEKFQLKKGQVIITKDSESANDIGVPTYVEETIENAVCGYHLAILEPQSTKIEGEFLFRFIQTSNVAIYFENNSNGVTRFGLGKPKIENLYVVLPSIEEQSTIIEYINYQSELIDKSVSKIKLVIEKLQTYRQSLISEAVTGKIDVRDWEITKN